MDGVTNMDYAEQHEQVCDAILENQSISYPCSRGSVSPYSSNDLADKLHEHSGDLLRAYILGNDEQILSIMKKLCNDEIESIIDLIWG